MMTFEFASIILAAFGSVSLSLFTFFKNPKSATNILFVLFALALTLYTFLNYQVNIQMTDNAAFFWVKHVMAIALVINLFFYLLAASFPGREFKMDLKFWSAVILTLIGIPLSYLNLIFTSAKSHGGGGEPGVGMGFFLFQTAVLLGTGFIVLVRKFLKSTGKEKTQIKLFISGTLFLFVSIIVINLLLVVLFSNSNFISLLPVYILIFNGIISYAIIKHRFLDIRVALARTVGFTLIVTLIALFYIVTTFTIGAQFFAVEIDRQILIWYTAMTMFIALTFTTFKNFVQNLTNKIFYQGHYSAEELLSEIGKIISFELDLRNLSYKLLDVITKQMKITKGSFVLLDNQKIYDVISIGSNKPFNYEYGQIEMLTKNSAILLYEELPAGALKDLLSTLDIYVSIVLRVNDKIVGLLILSEKSSGEAYTNRDIKTLEIMGPQIAIAVQNSQSVDQIKRFNVILSQEVSRATNDLRKANDNLMNMNREVSRINEQLQQLDKMKDEFVSIASHELRTPMTAIRSYVWMAINRSDIPLSPKLKKYLERTLLSTERLINLVNDMLNISRIESGRLEIKPNRFSLATLLNDIQFEVDAKAKEQKVKVNLIPAKIPDVFADADKVHQVMLNLVGNALKFTPPGGSIEISTFSDGQMVGISVHDNGVGINKDDLYKLFTKFGRLDNSYVAAATSGGTGLGLYICKSLVELMGGKIKAESAGLGKGTTFSFTLPVATNQIVNDASKYQNLPVGGGKGLEPVAL